MKFSLVNNDRCEPLKGLKGLCIGCGEPMIPKCGPIKIWHWAHKSNCECDHWWENETDWHRKWKNYFPKDWQEVRHKSETGEWHISDVQTKDGNYLEFQHSYLNSDERQARNNFYGSSLVWIVDGMRRQKDYENFKLLLNNTSIINANISIRKLLTLPSNCSIWSEWSECNSTVFFDFGETSPLWCLMPKGQYKFRYLFPYPRESFVAIHSNHLNGKSFSDLLNFMNKIIFLSENPIPNVSESNATIPLLRRMPIPMGINIKQLNYFLRPKPRRVRFRF